MLDLHSVYDATGSTDTIVVENNANAVIPTGDGATTIGVSPWNGAVLCSFGAHVVAGAQALVTLGMQSNNLVDPVNKLADTATGTDTSIIRSNFLQLGYGNGPNLVTYANEAAGKTATFKIDAIRAGQTVAGSMAPANLCQYSTTAGGAATAGVYQTIAFAPTTTPPVGTYAILGTKTSALTTAAALRFQHTDFGGAFPGYPIVDTQVGTLTYANNSSAFASREFQGYQFVKLGQILGIPCCPVFRIQGQGTGLNFQLLDTAGDTVSIALNLMKIG